MFQVPSRPGKRPDCSNTEPELDDYSVSRLDAIEERENYYRTGRGDPQKDAYFFWVVVQNTFKACANVAWKIYLSVIVGTS